MVLLIFKKPNLFKRVQGNKQMELIYILIKCECIINCLQLAVTLGIKSIAFPLLEPFNGHISKSKISAIMLFAIKQFLKDNSNSSLEEIKISSQDTSVIRLFKYIINHLLCDNSETTIDPKIRSALKTKTQKLVLYTKASIMIMNTLIK
ncbi:unnamed protein product (macronuclear) [Paramecium tetraurelia]|uniref:Macro domain-containing protein n=1 Tax=Paramecium tetraurelia TaxID=5888 RepID=A0C2D5_PARTE|nr:uncharacterized protein GSPATT00034429001 [Paramecium tetraurelia]CAK64952.1 unnamed protein product [Paramecium tetraurelia]|eukprot:XP_001432349.1 hypothetical protein (macronuclear) [Paramecium tetraurelia strain d4-2]